METPHQPALIKAGDWDVNVSATGGGKTVTTSQKFKLTKCKDSRFGVCTGTTTCTAPTPYFVIEYDDNPQYSHLDPELGTTPKGYTNFNEGDKVYYRVTVKDPTGNVKFALSDALVGIVGGSSAVTGVSTQWLTSATQCASVSGENWMGENSAAGGVTTSYFIDASREYYGITQADGQWHWNTTLSSGVGLDNTKTGITIDNSGTYPTIKGWLQIPKPKKVEYGEFESYTTDGQGSGRMCGDADYSQSRMPIAGNQYLLIKDQATGQNIVTNPPNFYGGACTRTLYLHNPLNKSMSTWPRIVDSCAGSFYPLVSVKVDPDGASGQPAYRVINDSQKTQGAGNYFNAKTWDKQAECMNIEWIGAKSLVFGVLAREWTDKVKLTRDRQFAVYNKRPPKLAYGAGSSLDCVNDPVLTAFTPHLTGSSYGGVAALRLWRHVIWKSEQFFKKATTEYFPAALAEYCSTYFDNEERTCTDEETDETEYNCTESEASDEGDDDWVCGPRSVPSGLYLAASQTAKDGETHWFKNGGISIADLVKKNGTSVLDTCAFKNSIVLGIRTTGTPKAKNESLVLNSIDFQFDDGSVYPSRKVPAKNCSGWPCYYNFEDSGGNVVRNTNFCTDTSQHARRK